MLFVPNDNGTAIGNIVASIARAQTVSGVEVHLLDDRLVTFIRFSEEPRPEEPGQAKKRRKTKTKDKAAQNNKSRGTSSSPEKFAYGGKELTAREWAVKLGIAENTVRYRLKRYGNPRGLKGPTDGDKIVAGAS